MARDPLIRRTPTRRTLTRQTLTRQTLTRRDLLAAAASSSLVPLLAACSGDPDAGPATTTPARPSPSPGSARLFLELEEEYDARLGVFALDVASGRLVQHRAEERFAFCSTVKTLIVGVLLQRTPVPGLARVARYTRADLVDYSPVTEKFVDDGMTLRALADAAIRYSDNTAANLLLRELGGPGQVQGALRTLGDTVTNVDRTEPALNTAVPGDGRDTTTPRALANSYRLFTTGTALPADRRRLLVSWLDGNTTGDKLIRSAIPDGWVVGDKTGAGSYGTRNDVALLRPPQGGPIVLAVMSSKAAQDAEYDDELIARAARGVLLLLGHRPA